MVGSDTYMWGIKDFHKRWSGSLAKRRLCLGPAGVINFTRLKKKKKRCKPGTSLVVQWLRLCTLNAGTQV